MDGDIVDAEIGDGNFAGVDISDGVIGDDDFVGVGDGYVGCGDIGDTGIVYADCDFGGIVLGDGVLDDVDNDFNGDDSSDDVYVFSPPATP